MELRGAAPSSVCPRCGTEAPPTDEVLAHCVTCKLAYDPKAPRVEPPPRRGRVEDVERGLVAPRGVQIERVPGEVTVWWSLKLLDGLGSLFLGIVCLAFLIVNLATPGESFNDLFLLSLVTIAALYRGTSRSFGAWVLRVDERRLLVRREPLRLSTGVSIDRSEIQQIALIRPERASSRHHELAVITPRGAIVLGRFDARHLAQARCIRDVATEALAEIEIKPA